MTDVVGKYTRVGQTKGPLTIGGASKKMNDDSTFTYVPDYHVAGTLSEIKEWLGENHPDQMASVLKRAYNLKNLKTGSVKKSFDTEVSKWDKIRLERIKTRNEEKNVNLLILVELLKRYNDQRKDGMALDTKSHSTRDYVSETIRLDKVLDVTTVSGKLKGTRLVLKQNSVKKRLSTVDSDPLYHVVYNPRNKEAHLGVRCFLNTYDGFTDEQLDLVSTAVLDGNEVSIETPDIGFQSHKSPLTKRFTSPLRRDNDNSVDDLLDEL